MPETWSQVIDSMYTSTWAYRRPKATEQAYLNTPLFFWMKQKDHVESLSAYRRIEIPLQYGRNETVRWIGKGSVVPIQDSELLTMCYEDWKYVAVTVPRYFTEDQQNRGKAQAIRLIGTKLDAAERALNEEHERVLHLDGTGALEPNGIQNLIAAVPTSGIVHGINRATAGNEWWQNQTKASAGSAALYLKGEMRTCLNDIIKYSRAEIRDIVLLTNQTIYEIYEDIAMEMKILSNTMLADAGFDTIQFKGKPIMWTPSAPAEEMRFINTKFMKWYIDQGFWMEMTDWKQIPDQPFDKVAQIVCAENLTIDRAVCHKVLTGIKA